MSVSLLLCSKRDRMNKHDKMQLEPSMRVGGNLQKLFARGKFQDVLMLN